MKETWQNGLRRFRMGAGWVWEARTEGGVPSEVESFLFVCRFVCYAAWLIPYGLLACGG